MAISVRPLGRKWPTTLTRLPGTSRSRVLLATDTFISEAVRAGIASGDPGSARRSSRSATMS